MPLRLDPPQPTSTDGDGVIVRRVVVDGPYEPVPGRLTVPAATSEPDTLLLLGHGGGGTKDDGRIGALATRFTVALGAATLALDGPVHGERQPTHADRAERFRMTRRALVDPTMPQRFAEEHRAGVDQCRDIGIGTGPLLYAGFSMGTLLGVPIVAHLGDVTAAVFGIGGVPAPGGVAQLVRSVAGDAAADIVDEEDDAAQRGAIVLEAARRIARTRVLMLNVTRDVVFPIANAFELFDAFTCPKTIAFWDGEHTTLSAEAIDFAIAFFERAILRGGP